MLPGELFLGIHMYGIMIAVGLLLAFIVLFVYGKKIKMEQKLLDFTFYNGIVAIVAGFFFAAVFQGVYNAIAGKGFSLTGGITFIGGLIGGAACFLVGYFLIGKKYGNISSITKVVPCSILIAHAFGRIGCLMAGCCHGAYLGDEPVFGGIYMLGTTNGWGYYVPTQLYEAVFLLVVFAIVTYLVIKKDFNFNLETYLISYGVFRFVIEYLRDDYRGSFLGILSPSQFWSVLMVIAGVALIFIKLYKEPILSWLKKLFKKTDIKDDVEDEVIKEEEAK